MLRESLHDGIKLPARVSPGGLPPIFSTPPRWPPAGCIIPTRTHGAARQKCNGRSRRTWRHRADDRVLFGGQLLPFVLLTFAPMLSTAGLLCAALATTLAFAPRFVGVWRFRQPLGSALLHPLGVMALLTIQWYALAGHWLGKPKEWKGRTYAAATRIEPAKAT